ncbi:MAG: CHC2 zinc finger domain-containing protein [Verrucomicrobiota bacterium]
MFDTEEIRVRTSMRDLFERAGVTDMRKAGKSYVCRCPFHEEKTGSCYVHEAQYRFYCFGCGAKGDAFEFWSLVRGIDFKTAVGELAVLAGVSPGAISPTFAIKRAERKPELDWFPPPMSAVESARWETDIERLSFSAARKQQISEWRGFRPEFVDWLIANNLMGLTLYYNQPRVSFVVKCPLEGAFTPVGVHLRLEPDSAGNPHPKQSWRYTPARSESLPNGVGAWPFVLGDPAKADIWFMFEGQWDACAFANLMQWDVSWPPRVAVIGIRGSASWPLLLRAYPFRPGLTCFVVADNDTAGREWWASGGFLDQLEAKEVRVFAYRAPEADGCKDYNDATRLGLVTKESETAQYLSRILPRRPKPKGKPETFIAYCKRIAVSALPQRNAAGFVLAMPKRPRQAVSLRVWESLWEQAGVTGNELEQLIALYNGWKEIF